MVGDLYLEHIGSHFYPYFTPKSLNIPLICFSCLALHPTPSSFHFCVGGLLFGVRGSPGIDGLPSQDQD